MITPPPMVRDHDLQTMIAEKGCPHWRMRIADMAEIRRVLKSTGRLAVLEHVRGEGRLARWQDRLTPLWTRFAAGCHPNRDTLAAIERAGFSSFEWMERFAVAPGWVPTSPMLELVARAIRT